MTTRKEKVTELAARIRRAASLSEAKVASAGRHSASEGFGEEVLAVIATVEGLAWTREEGTTPFSQVEIEQTLSDIDAAIGVAPGTLKQIKEGSVKSLLQYNLLISQLMSTLNAGRK